MSKEIPFEKSFASHEKAKYWSDKNVLKPESVFKSSDKKILFKCDCGHEFSSRLGNIVNGGWCPYCGNKKLCENNECNTCFEKSFASNRKTKYWCETNGIIPRYVFIKSNKKYIFNCDCGHRFDKILCDISENNGWCPYCCNPPNKLCENIECKTCFEKSFACHEKAKYWSASNKTNPRQEFLNCNNKFLFNCECGHEFEQNLNHINRGNWCPYCCYPSLKLCNKDDCKQCFEKSFASHEKSKYWSNKNKYIPRQILRGSHSKFIFNCECSHEFTIILKDIMKPQWCGYCSSPPKLLCDKEDCKICFEKSFASHEMSKLWNNKINKENPREVFKISGKKYWLTCAKCNKDFDSTLANITRNNNNCPYCVNKTEQKLFDNLQPIYNNLQQQYKVDWCKSDTTKKCYPFDFILEDQKIIIELDGRQHFEQISNWDNPEKVQERDKYKMKQANDNGYSVIRILQEDVYYNTYQWLDELKINIENIITKCKIQNIFMCKDNEYKIFEVLD
jgi:very-short-patch-repair endonuclease